MGMSGFYNNNIMFIIIHTTQKYDWNNKYNLIFSGLLLDYF